MFEKETEGQAVIEKREEVYRVSKGEARRDKGIRHENTYRIDRPAGEKGEEGEGEGRHKEEDE